MQIDKKQLEAQTAESLALIQRANTEKDSRLKSELYRDAAGTLRQVAEQCSRLSVLARMQKGIA